MSYEKKAGPPKVLRFYYETNEIFNQVSRATSFKAADVLKENGRAAYDRIQISTDEKEFMMSYLREGMLEVFISFFQIIISDNVIHDTALTLEDTTEVTASYCDLIDNEKYRNINLSLIDQKIFNCLVAYIISKWYSLKRIEGASEYMAEFNNTLAEIDQKSLQLRQPA